MSAYQTFIDGLALGFILGFLAFYLLYRLKAYRSQKSESDIDILVDDIKRYYQHVSERKRRDFD